MDSDKIATIADVRGLEARVHRFVSPPPLIRSYALEKKLKISASRRVWLKDYGWTPTGSFKVMGALGWMSTYDAVIGQRPVAACSSGNFASGLAFASQKFGKRAIIVMPDSAPRIKFDLTRSFGAEVRTYDISRDHLTGERERMTRQIAEEENAVQASPYDNNAVIAGNGVGGLEIVSSLTAMNRGLSHVVCPVSGGGLLSGIGLAIEDAFPNARILAVEPEHANDFQQSLTAGHRVSLEKPESICDGLLSYEVGEHNWPILQRCVSACETVSDSQVRSAMAWIYQHHGLRTEPSGAIAIATLLAGRVSFDGDGDIVAIISGRNIDEAVFGDFIR